MSKSEWEKLNLWACSSIRLCLAKTQKYFVMRETVASVLWQKLEDKYMMKNEFEMKDLGEAKKILGMEITRDREKGLVSLNQRQYLEELVLKGLVLS
ncbi:hypothetical protein ACFX2I_025762 [Malus domestica]